MFGTQNVPVNKNRYKLQLFFYLFCFRSYLIDYDRWMLNFFFVSKFFCCFVSILFFFLVLGDKLEVCYGEKRTSRGTSDIHTRDKRKQNTQWWETRKKIQVVGGGRRISKVVSRPKKHTENQKLLNLDPQIFRGHIHARTIIGNQDM